MARTQRSASPKSRSQRSYRLVSFIGQDDSDILPFFLAHYRTLGVGEFHVFVHGNWTTAELAPLHAKDVTIAGFVQESFDEVTKTATLEAYAKRFVGEWIVFADADEFLELPYPSLTHTIKALTSVGVTELPANLVQRAHPEGILASLEGHASLDELFPKYDYRLAERMGVRLPVWKNKYPLAQIGPDFRLARGFHMPTGGKPAAHVPIRAVLHHFKWRDRLVRSTGRNRGKYANQEEQEAYRAWLEAYGFRLPTDGLKQYSRATLFKDGHLIRATARETAHYAALRNASVAGSDAKTAGARRAMASVPTAIRPTDRRAASYLDRKWLAGRRGRIALVTPDLLGLRRTGGIGTAMAALAECLAAAGHHVDVFLVPYANFPDLSETWHAYWRARGVRVHHFTRLNPQGRMATPSETSLLIAEALAEEDWDVVHVAEAGGMGAASLLQRAAGTAFHDTRFVVTVHGPTPWHRAGNLLPWAEDEAAFTHLEQISIELADVLVSPSAYMKAWCAQHFPSRAPHLAIPNSLSGESRRFGRWPSARRPVTKIVFFGRIEQRKGLDWFLSAIETVLAEGQRSFEVVFLGTLGHTISLAELAQRTARWLCRVQVLTEHTSHEAVEYLRTEDCLAVLLSRADNSPYTVYECIQNGIPFIASDVGGIAELVHPDDRARVLGNGGGDEYARRILDTLNGGAAPARPGFDPMLVDVDLLALHGALVSEAQSARGIPAASMRRAVTVIVYGAVEPDPAILRVLERWGSDGAEVFLDRFAPSGGWRPEIGGGSRASVLNRLAEAATGDSVLFCHASVLPQVESITAMQTALATTGADAVVGGYRRIDADGEADAVPVFAGPPEWSTSKNIYGARLFLVRRRRFLKMGGFATEPDVADIMEREFLNRLHAGGGRIFAIPSPIALVIADESPAVLNYYQLGRLAVPWVAAAPELAQRFVRMALQPEWKAVAAVPAAVAVARPVFPGLPAPTVIAPAAQDSGGATDGDLIAARPATAPLARENVKWELESQNEIGRLLIGKDGRPLRTDEGFTIQSVEDADGCDFLLADDFLPAADADLLVNAFRNMSGASAKDTRLRRNPFFRIEEILEADESVVAPLIRAMRKARDVTARFHDVAAPLYPAHGRITQIRAGTFVMPARGIVLPRAVAEQGRTPRFGGALWLNDDFKGGDAYFTGLDMTVKSRPLRYIGHTATSTHELAWLRVTSGAMVTMSLVLGLDADEMSPLLRRHF